MPLLISHIDSLAQDRFSKNGVSKQLHIVAKNIAFVVHVEAPFNLNKAPLTAKLFYDFEDGEPREVETLKVAPLEYTSHVNDSGDKATVEVRINVLSSQHEGAYFRVKISAVNPENNKVNEVYSDPFKIISKRNQVKKIIAKQQHQQQTLASSPMSSPVHSPPSPVRTPAISAGADVSQALQRLEDQQRDQAQLLQRLFQQVSGQSLKRPSDDFEAALENFLDAYRRTSPQERASKIRKVVKDSTEYQHTLEELTDICTLEGYAPLRSNGCLGSTCPHKRELENLDLIYSEFLVDPVSSDNVEV